ncbi:MAG: ketoacyl-ACP synthase III [Anaerolineae bacterium]|jgi:3-oxoacyl-[acyl-carrier-protein] synthase-3|nr:ketoacyl-ACP synthase III [Anaerolineae bacterium]MBT4309783.1 ketoacyl-ACP synthase III [Anaerolineae bacterium]MBT4460074.1 ketoacyl-ACP synthase III [Anaerolineae bacterium]MBT4841321.1 ketoacyl-ACP synthase III [Anaerolineae bacterium]MBT6060633.1 ketoacyl-ACP synthase III [Anaerolineae bacterium]
MPYAHITGWGMAVPETVRTNDDLSKMVDTNDEWIRSRTGIAERRIANDEESSASLGADAALRALEVANLRAADLDLIIVASSSPEHIFPATASLVQDRIGAINAGAFDISAACTGFIFAVNMAAQSIRSGASKNVLVVGAETLSRFVDWTDRNTCILFGDGAGAFVLQENEEPGGVLAEVMHSDGSGGDLLSIPAGGSKLPTTEATIQAGQHLIQMDGKGVFRFATRVMARATKEALEKADLEIEDLDLVIPHQANTRIIEAAARGLKLPMDKFMVNLDKYGNTSTASIPIATVEAFESGRITPGDKIVMVGFGGGLTWGALVAEWTGPLPTERKVRHGWLLFLARIRSVLLRVLRIVEGMLWGRYGRS